MSDDVLICEQGVVLLGGGNVSEADFRLARGFAPALVAADGGGDRALALGALPDRVIGDMDSLSAEGRIRLAGRLHPVAEQESTDFGKCLRLVQAPFYLCLGFSGLRLDHTLAALSELAQRPVQRIVMLTEEEVVFRAPETFAIELPPAERLSLFPFGPVTGRSVGLVWPLDGIALTPAGRVGTSNAVDATGQVRIAVTGDALILLPKRHLAAVLAAL